MDFGPLRWSLRDNAAGSDFMLANGRRNPIHVEAMCAPDLLSELVEFLDDGIALLHDDALPGSSSGVRMIGGRKP